MTGSTHDDRQMITKDAPSIAALNERLWRKIRTRQAELERVRLDLQPDAETLCIAFGTSAGAMEESLQCARTRGKRVSGAVVQSLWPIPRSSLLRAARGTRLIVVGELNPGLYAREVRCLCSEQEVVSLSRLDGQMITPEMFASACL